MRLHIEVFYSEEDEGYIAKIKEIEGISAFGKSVSEALRELIDAIEAVEACGCELCESEKNVVELLETMNKYDDEVVIEAIGRWIHYHVVEKCDDCDRGKGFI